MAALRNLVSDDGAVADGSTDNGPAFDSFQTWAAAQVGQIILTIPAGNYNITTTTGPSGFWTDGVTDLIVEGTGASITRTSGMMRWGGGGLFEDGDHRARVQFVKQGSLSATLLTEAEASIFAVDDWVMLAGVDLQGQFNSNFGFPPNLHLFEFKQISDITGAVITFTEPVRFYYLATWPNFTIWEEGPASLFLVQGFERTLDFRGLTIDNGAGVVPIIARAKDVTWRNSTVLNADGAIPTINKNWRAIGCDFSTCVIEVDKGVESALFQDSELGTVDVQSTSVHSLEVRNCTASGITGTPKHANIVGSTIGTLRPGATGYGSSQTLHCRDSVITTFNPSDLSEKGLGDTGVKNNYSMANGILSFPTGTTISGAADNGSGLIRLTVASSAGFTTGKKAKVRNVGGTTEANGVCTITVVDATHIDLQGTTFTNAYTSGGQIVGQDELKWAVPGGHYFWVGSHQNSGYPFRVIDMWQDAHSTYIRTSLTGGFPPVPESNGLFIRVHPAPSCTLVNCTGSPIVVDMSQPGAWGKPYASYSKRTYTGSDMDGSFPTVPLWGELKELHVRVSTAYTGAQGTLTLKPFGQFAAAALDPPNYSASTTWNSTVNLKTAGTRSLVVGQGWTGSQAGDSLTDPGAIWLASGQAPFVSADISGESAGAWPVVEIEVVTDQKIYRPGSMLFAA